MDVGADTICMIKTNTKSFYKYTIEKLTKYWQGIFYLTLKRKSTVPSYRPLIHIGYKYNYHKVIYFIPTEDSESKKSGITY